MDSFLVNHLSYGNYLRSGSACYCVLSWGTLHILILLDLNREPGIMPSGIFYRWRWSFMGKTRIAIETVLSSGTADPLREFHHLWLPLSCGESATVHPFMHLKGRKASGFCPRANCIHLFRSFPWSLKQVFGKHSHCVPGPAGKHKQETVNSRNIREMATMNCGCANIPCHSAHFHQPKANHGELCKVSRAPGCPPE